MGVTSGEAGMQSGTRLRGLECCAQGWESLCLLLSFCVYTGTMLSARVAGASCPSIEDVELLEEIGLEFRGDGGGPGGIGLGGFGG